MDGGGGGGGGGGYSDGGDGGGGGGGGGGVGGGAGGGGDADGRGDGGDGAGGGGADGRGDGGCGAKVVVIGARANHDDNETEQSGKQENSSLNRNSYVAADVTKHVRSHPLFGQHAREKEHLNRRQVSGLRHDQKEIDIIREYSLSTFLS